MTLRALVVLLLVLNLGVAVWGLARPSLPEVEPPVRLYSPRLRLVGEPAVPGVQARGSAAATATAPSPGTTRAVQPAIPADRAAPAPADVPPPPAPAAPGDGTLSTPVSTAGNAAATPAPAAEVATATPVATQCAAFGPFADPVAMASAQRALGARGVAGIRIREVTTAPRGWQVRLAAQPDRAAADALAQRLGAAGFDDYLVVPSGADANGIALGRYRGERAARERGAALRAAGFDPLVEAVGEASTQRWLDFRAPAGFDADAARRATSAPASTLRACAGAD